MANRTLPVEITDGVTEMNAASVMDNFDYLQAKFPLPFEVCIPIPGTLAPGTSQIVNYVLGRYCELMSVYAQVNEAPAGNDIIVEVNIGTLPIGTVTILAGARSQQTNFSGFAGRFFTPVDYLRIDINQIGSVTPGSDLLLILRFRQHGANDTGP